VVISGSVARGLADDQSDLEIGVYWTEPPSLSLRDRAVASLGAKMTRRVTLGEGQAWFGVDNLRVQGFQVDVAMNTVAGIEATIRRVVAAEDLGNRSADLVGIIAEFVALAGPERVQAWQQSLVYDDALRSAMLKHQLKLAPASALEVDFARDDRFRVLERMHAWIARGRRALFALNKRWYPGHKAAMARIPELPIQPAHSVQRLDSALDGPTETAATTLVDWCTELYGLAAQHADVDDEQRHFLGSGRRRWTPPEVRALRIEI